jgi:hypothetical protein
MKLPENYSATSRESTLNDLHNASLFAWGLSGTTAASLEGEHAAQTKAEQER